MDAGLRNAINPATPVAPVQPIEAAPAAVNSNDQSGNFLEVMKESTRETKKARQAEGNKDLSTAKNYDEFLEKLSDPRKERREPKNVLNKDDFLKLFVTQLQNQDPLNPDDGAEMASKLAQFNSLEQMLNVNKTLEKMSDAQSAQRNFGLVSYIGKEVELASGKINVSGDHISQGHYEVKVPVTDGSLQIRDSSGTLIFEKNLGAIPVGDHDLMWDGKTGAGVKVPDGVYTASVDFKDIAGNDVPTTIDSTTEITGIDLKDLSGSFYTGLGRVAMTDIKSVGEKNYSATKKESAPPQNKTKAQTPAVPQAVISQVQAAVAPAAPSSNAPPSSSAVPAPLAPFSDIAAL